jgi:hypothetical protein
MMSEHNKWGRILHLKQMLEELESVYSTIRSFSFSVESNESQRYKVMDGLAQELRQVKTEMVELLASYTEEDKK